MTPVFASKRVEYSLLAQEVKNVGDLELDVDGVESAARALAAPSLVTTAFVQGKWPTRRAPLLSTNQGAIPGEHAVVFAHG